MTMLKPHGHLCRTLPVLSLCLSLTGCSLFGYRGGYEEAGYTRLEKDGSLELRNYRELVVVETVVDAPYREAGNQAFRRLFQYISGNNVSQTKIAMTAPVLADEPAGEKIAMTAPVIGEPAGESGWRYRFVLPRSYRIDTAPLPRDPEVKLAVLPPRKTAVIRYSGKWEEDAMRRKTTELKAWIADRGLTELSSPRSAGYDPPWTLPPMRRNEVMIDVQ